MTGATRVPQTPITANYKRVTCTDLVSEGDLNRSPMFWAAAQMPGSTCNQGCSRW